MVDVVVVAEPDSQVDSSSVDQGDTVNISLCGGGDSEGGLGAASRSSRRPRPSITPFLQLAKSASFVSRPLDFRCPDEPPTDPHSEPSSRSLVLTLCRAVELFSLLNAAVSRSGHSERFTNSYFSATFSVGLDDGPASPESLNSRKVAATLRPRGGWTSEELSDR